MARMYLNDQESQVWEQVNLKLQYIYEFSSDS